MSVNIDIRGEGVRPTLTTSRMSVYLSNTGSNLPEEAMGLMIARVRELHRAHETLHRFLGDIGNRG